MKTQKKKSKKIDENKEKFLAERRKRFDIEYQNIEQGEDKLYERLLLAGSISCSRCYKKEFTRCDGTRQIICVCCGNKQSFTAHTFFHKMKRASTLEYLFLLTLLDEGIIVNASEFERHSSVVYSTSLSMVKKCALVIQQAMDQSRLTEAHCSELKKVVARRSKETPARKHPQREQRPATGDQLLHQDLFTRTYLDEETGEVRSVTVPVGVASRIKELSTMEMNVLFELTDGPMVFDSLHARAGGILRYGDFNTVLTELELKGLLIMRGDKVKKTDEITPKELVIGSDLDPKFKRSIIEYIRESYQGISQKAAQFYCTLHAFHRDRDSWPEGKIFEIFMGSRSVKDKEVTEYVSPQVLKVSAFLDAERDVDLIIP